MSIRRGPLNIAFVWNMHQPYYKDLAASEYMMPWVRMHGIKDYYSIAHILRQFPDIHQTFNLVPSLLKQIRDYTATGLFNIKETSLNLTLKPAADLTKADKIYLLYNFFMANWHHMVYPYHRFAHLLNKRGANSSLADLDKIQGYFSKQEYLDLQIWGNLCWIDPFFKNDPRIKDLFERGADFKEEDKITLINVQQEIMELIIPEYRALAQSGQAELITSPLYHPILPLLCNSGYAHEALPHLPLPKPPFIHPEDAFAQLDKGIAAFKDIMGMLPQGMWPSEGSVCEEIIPMLAKCGIKWIATDEQILARSLNIRLDRDCTNTLRDPKILYQPYIMEKDGKSVNMVFRDHLLSDLIGFVYSKDKAESAANNLINRLLNIREYLPPEDHYLVTILLDGENAWEYYVNNGVDFLSCLYEKISNEPGLSAVTVSEYLERHPPRKHLGNLFAGSWIDHNFKIWIGHEEDNRGWEQIEMTRRTLAEYQKKYPDADPEIIGKAWEEIYITEGSDWFWWYGDEHHSANDEMFDNLFRRQLINVYKLLNLEPPDSLYISNIIEQRVCLPAALPKGFINPAIDGKVTNYFEWLSAGYFDVSKNRGSMQQAMHLKSAIIAELYFGFNPENLFLRLDFTKNLIQELPDYVFFINFLAPVECYLEIKKNSIKIYKQTGKNWKSKATSSKAALNNILEIQVPLKEIKGDILHIIISIEQNGVELERYPGKGYMNLTVPGENYEADLWQV